MWRYAASLRAIAACVLDGVCDSLRLPSTLIFFLSSVTVRVRTAHCFVLNGVIFLGSILLADGILAPMLRTLMYIGGGKGQEEASGSITGIQMPLASASIPLPGGLGGQYLGEWLNTLFLYAYQLLWIYPLYALSFILNAIWYQDIADHAYVTHGGATPPKSFNFQKWVAVMSDEVYRLLLVSAYALQMFGVSFLPFGLGSVLGVLHLSWMCSLYSFEYKWALVGWSLEYRLKYFERHWAYFLGFGLPAATLSVAFPKFISLGIFALAFPIFIILALIAKPTSHVKKLRRKSVTGKEQPVMSVKDPAYVASKNGTAKAEAAVATAATTEPVLLPQLPIFRLATWLNWWILSCLQRRTKATPRRPSIDASASLKPPPQAMASMPARG